jgi:hypothetical protein
MGVYQDYVGLGQTAPGGHYRFGVITGAVVGLTANQAILCWRWMDINHPLRIYRIVVEATINVAFGTAQASDIALFVNRNWTSAPSGGTAILPFKANENVMATQGVGVAMNQLSALTATGTLQVATTGALTTGTRMQDTLPIKQGCFNCIALGSADVRTLLATDYGNEYPLTLGNQEGVEITVPTAQGATGKVVYYINFEICVNNMIM